MLRRPPRSTLFPYTTSSDLLLQDRVHCENVGVAQVRDARWFFAVWLPVGVDHDEQLRAVVYDGAHVVPILAPVKVRNAHLDRKSTRLNSSHANISYAVFCLK